jgi:hypothetical protein
LLLCRKILIQRSIGEPEPGDKSRALVKGARTGKKKYRDSEPKPEPIKTLKTAPRNWAFLKGAGTRAGKRN